MKITLLDAETLGNDLDFSSLSQLGETVFYKNTKENEIATNIADSDVVIVNKIKLNKDTLKGVSSLKLILVAATGYDNIDLNYCRSHGIAVCNVVGYSTHSVAQVTLAAALSLYTHLPEYNRYVDSGAYTKSGVANRLIPVYHELYGKVWGVVGLGNIGRQVARVAKSMGCDVVAFKRTPDEEYKCISLKELCAQSDIISVHLPLSDETRGIISKDLIASMKTNAIFINVSRGAVTDEAALAEAILENRIGGFATDVYSAEPFGETHPFTKLLSLDNVCFTPHMAWGAFEARQRCMDEIVLNIKSFYEGAKRNRLD